ncbi:MAG: ABC transporter substrate-binding protein [Olsenella sp.]|jgi:polar amino acid transport system substrate-binding protein|nr:ABC transporter substrate-binding protein [Olsenella sp.]
MKANLSRRDFLAVCGLGLTAGLVGCGSTSGSSSSTGSSSSSDSSASDSSSSSGDYNLVNDGKLTMISNFNFPPFVSIDPDSKDFVGFDVDMYKEICKRLNLAENILPSVQFDTIVPTIKQGGKADISLGAITITDDRKEEVAMSDPYLDSNQSIVVKKGATATTQDALNADGMQIAVQSGTTGEDWAKENLPNATIVPLDDIIQAMTGVQSGLYNACVADLPVTEYEIKIAYSDLEIPDGGEIPTGEQYGAVINKNNTALLKAVNKALKDIKADGTQDTIEKTWFGSVISSS